jgi:hypothetical protein
MSGSGLFHFLRNQNTATVSEGIRRHRYTSCDWLDTLQGIQIPH